MKKNTIIEMAAAFNAEVFDFTVFDDSVNNKLVSILIDAEVVNRDEDAFDNFINTLFENANDVTHGWMSWDFYFDEFQIKVCVESDDD